MENENCYNFFDFLKSKKCLFFLYTGRRFGIGKRAGCPSLLVNSSNHFIDMSVLYQINSTLAISRLKHLDTDKAFRY